VRCEDGAGDAPPPGRPSSQRRPAKRPAANPCGGCSAQMACLASGRHGERQKAKAPSLGPCSLVVALRLVLRVEAAALHPELHLAAGAGLGVDGVCQVLFGHFGGGCHVGGALGTRKEHAAGRGSRWGEGEGSAARLGAARPQAGVRTRPLGTCARGLRGEVQGGRFLRSLSSRAATTPSASPGSDHAPPLPPTYAHR
jgi:hypothetical protein